MKSVAIIGSRRINDHQFNYIVDIAHAFAERNWKIRTGCALGADYASMIGARSGGGNPSLYLPWLSYNKHLRSPNDDITVYDDRLHQSWTNSVSNFHPAPSRLSQGAFKLMARNYGIIEGADLVIAHPMSLTDLGGTGQGMRIARDLGIPLFNVFSANDQFALAEQYFV
jgi:hypothetical protein